MPTTAARIKVISLATGFALVALVNCQTPKAGAVEYRRIDVDEYQTFVKNWDATRQPERYALIDSTARYHELFGPAAKMFGNKPFAPPDSMFKSEEMVLVARVTPAGDMAKAFEVERVTTNDGGLQIHYRYHEPPPASSSVNNYLALWVPRDDYKKVTFVENGKTVGELKSAQGEWSLPAPM